MVGSLVAFPQAGAQQTVDRLGEALEMVGFDRSDIGCTPKGYWSRFPNIDRIPQLLPFFKDLLAEPLHTYEFARVMAGALEEHLDPAYREGHEVGMFKVVHFLGIEKKVVGPRGYDYAEDFHVFMPATDSSTHSDAVAEAMARVFEAAGEHLDGENRKKLDAELAGVPGPLQEPLARLLHGVAAAWEWRQIAVARLAEEDMQEVFASGPPREKDFLPAADRVGMLIDEVSLYHAAKLAVLAVEKASRAFEAALDSSGVDARSLAFEFHTPIGGVVLAGTGDDAHACADCAVLIDLGGDDEYSGPVGSTPSLRVPVSVAIDLDGNDVYRSESDLPSQGAAILGVGILLDRAGDDRYRARNFAQGAGYFGLGLLWDDSGTDEYELQFSGQGGAYFGIGLLVDGEGDDSYYLWADGQGFGGVGGGVGVLADASGNDSYTAEVDAHVTGRGSNHTHKRVSSSNAQGSGSGRRGDISDGHAWAGGLGALLDLQGDDTYEAGNWAIGAGYWFATGLLYDGGGDDTYQSVYYSMSSGAHFSIGALIDETGNDTYRMVDPPIADDLVPAGVGMNAAGGAGLAFAWDFCTALLIDKAGDDSYEGRIISGGLAMIRSTAVFADLAGNDRYVFPAAGGGQASPSRIKYPPDVLPSFRIEYSPASNYGSNFGFFLDAGGEDEYLEFRADGKHRPAAIWRNGHIWRQPDPADEQFEYNSRGIGMDVESGTVPEFHRFERR